MISHLRLPVLASLLAVSTVLWPAADGPTLVEREGYVGTASCRACHTDQYSAWYGSPHRRALAEAGWIGADEWRVQLDAGEAGWTVGKTVRHLPLGADASAAETLKIDEAPQLLERHWARPGASFARDCADCHLGDWSAANASAQSLEVSCETCHGPGARHAEWGKAQMMGRKIDDPEGTKGWSRLMFTAHFASWEVDEATGSAKPRELPSAREQVDTCLRCHAMNDGRLVDRVMVEGERLDALLPHLPLDVEPGKLDLAPNAAFELSRMHSAGVACSDCHDQHSGKLYAPDDTLCLRCHDGGRFQTEEHKGHAGDTAPACVDCHMPRAATGARSHLLIPPGDPVAALLGQPDACASCHADWSAEERAKALAARPGTPRAARARDVLAVDDPAAWRKLALDATASPMLRAAAARQGVRDASAEQLASLLGCDEPLVRLATLRGLRAGAGLPNPALLAPLASDPLRAVRVELGRLVEGKSVEERTKLFGDAAAAVEAAVREAASAR
ncbi:MAG: hypothetical protein H6831_10070 [Planctomycetes bacterium]|nr:hypothetical protein [Planctomycetota bacterium]